MEKRKLKIGKVRIIQHKRKTKETQGKYDITINKYNTHLVYTTQHKKYNTKKYNMKNITQKIQHKNTTQKI